MSGKKSKRFASTPSRNAPDSGHVADAADMAIGANKSRDETAVLLWLRIARVHGRLSNVANRHIREHGLTPAQFDVIAQAGSTPGLTQEQLAERLFVTQGNITQLLGRMEKASLVKRVRDARCNRVRLTSTGERLYEEVIPSHEAQMAAQFGALTAVERGQLVALLRKLDRSLRSKSSNV